MGGRALHQRERALIVVQLRLVMAKRAFGCAEIVPGVRQFRSELHGHALLVERAMEVAETFERHAPARVSPWPLLRRTARRESPRRRQFVADAVLAVEPGDVAIG